MMMLRLHIIADNSTTNEANGTTNLVATLSAASEKPLLLNMIPQMAQQKLALIMLQVAAQLPLLRVILQKTFQLP